MILTDEEIEKCRELFFAFRAAKKSQQSCKGQQVTTSDDYESQVAWATEVAILAKLNSAEPVAWMAPGKESLEFSRKDTVYGSHTIPLYLHPPAPSALSNELAQCQKELNAKQAKIDSLMLEYCPDEMTEAQFNKWGECQMPHGRADAIKLEDRIAEIAELKADRDDCLALAKLNLASELKYKALCDQLAYVIENSEIRLYDSGKEALAAYRAMKGSNDGHRSRLLG